MNTAARVLGMSPGGRAVIVHADDVGMCQASVPAFRELAESGSISSASVMVPCPWFREVAKVCKALGAFDMGVHLTLTSEWSGCRWAPISTIDADSGLIDREGYFHARRRDALDHVRPQAAYVEMRAQLDRARAAGIDVTHLDAHMFTALWPPLTESYLRLGMEAHLPVLAWHGVNDGHDAIPEVRGIFECAESQGLLTLDHVRHLPPGAPEQRERQFREAVDTLPAGVTHLLIHPAIDGPELRQMMPAWRERVADYEFFRGPAARNYLEKAGVKLIAYSDLREAMRGQRADALG